MFQAFSAPKMAGGAGGGVILPFAKIRKMCNFPDTWVQMLVAKNTHKPDSPPATSMSTGRIRQGLKMEYGF